MQELAFPTYQFRFKNKENKLSIFDEVRKKFIVLTPEEWVRQHCIQFLIQEKNYPRSLINVEKELKINDLSKRYDIVVYHPDGTINVLVECKSAKIKITQDTFDQIARYNFILKADHLMLTNGLNHYYCKMNFDKEAYDFLRALPKYKKKS
ncbi:MAG: type I restriction enzyme HsdR N-terminal domain-containing protein [Flavobacteriaceae bacterium]|nr:type I restriction enzyme HsdR N-terminal domain-containing protein [Flavobacteriaceae bacterium]